MNLLHQDANLLEVHHLKKYFPIRRGILGKVVGEIQAVNDITLAIAGGETFGLVGESGCGKSTAARTILRLIEPSDGTILFRSHILAPTGKSSIEIDVTTLSKKLLKKLRRDMQIIYQDPYSSLNPRMTVLDIIAEPLQVHEEEKGQALQDRVGDLLIAVGLKPEHMNRYPHEFSGGQRQRIGIARALALHPQLIIADEPVSALDVSVQAQVLNLLQELQENFRLTYLFISHDLSVVRHISTRVAVMYLGQIFEMAGTDDLFGAPKHPYTEALMTAVPVPNPDLMTSYVQLQGEVGNPANPPAGCTFHPRCAYAQGICGEERPEYSTVGEEHFVKCHFADTLELKGIGGT